MNIDIIALAILIVAAFCGGGAFHAAGRSGAGAWLSMTLALLTFGLVQWVALAAAGR